MKKDNLEIILSNISENTLGEVLDEREKRLKKFDMKMKKLKEADSSFEEIIIEEETKKEKIKRIILKVLSAVAAVAVIAGMIYVVRIPIHMNNNAPTPAYMDSSETASAYTSSSETDPVVTDKEEYIKLSYKDIDEWLDPDRKDKIKKEDIDAIHQRKIIFCTTTLRDLVAMLGKPQRDVGASGFVFEWDIDCGNDEENAPSEFSYRFFDVSLSSEPGFFTTREFSLEKCESIGDLYVRSYMTVRKSYDFEDAIVSFSEFDPSVVEFGAEKEPEWPDLNKSGRFSADMLTAPDDLTDISLVKIGMKFDEVENVLAENSYSLGIPSKRGVCYYVNDRETGHVFFIICKDGRVSEIRDSGIEVDYIAPAERLAELHDGMDFDDVVDILGRPLYRPTRGEAFTFRVGGKDSYYTLLFSNVSDSSYYNRYFESDLYVLYNYSETALPSSYYDRTRAGVLCDFDDKNISDGMTFGQICAEIGYPVGNMECDDICMIWFLESGQPLYVYFINPEDSDTDPATDLIAYYHSGGYDWFGYIECPSNSALIWQQSFQYKWCLPDRKDKISFEEALNVKTGMTFKETVDLIGKPQSVILIGGENSAVWDIADSNYKLVIVFHDAMGGDSRFVKIVNEDGNTFVQSN